MAQTEMVKYQQSDLPVAERVADLVSRMTLEEKISQMRFDAPAIDRLGIPAYNWWNECLHGVARAGVATVFPQAIGLAATWNTDLMFEVATVISDEARAKHHEAVRQNDRGIYKGLTMWSPNINIFRDPRWGRGQETYGEDPFLTARMGVAFVKGLQGNDPKYLKVVATPKHYAVHSGPEPDRHHFDARVDDRDLWETYLPAFEACVTEAKAWSVMGAYNRFNGEACCASPRLLRDILRGDWGFPGYVVSDCGAIKDIWSTHQIVKTAPEAAALAVKMGCDLNCGDQYPRLIEAVVLGLITEAEIDIAVSRLMEARFRLGLFDPPEQVAYAQIPYSVNDAPAHSILALQAARESIVLLKNEKQFLPLKKNLKTIAVIGPNANRLEALVGNYNGTPSNPVTPLAGIRAKVSPQTQVLFAPGCNLTDDAPLLEVVPAQFLQTPDGTPGLAAQYFNNMQLSGAAQTAIDSVLNFNWLGSVPASGVPSEKFSARWTGKLVPPQSGEYTLAVAGDDGYRLYWEDRLLIDNWRDHGVETQSAKLKLEAGHAYAFRLEYFQNGGDAVLKLLWSLPGASAFEQAVAAARKAEVAIVVAGISPEIEGEEMDTVVDGFHRGDRTRIDLPVIQEKLLQAVHATGTPVVLVVLSGSGVTVNWAQAHVPAVIAAWYPGQQGGAALADVLFGDYNPAGRLPVTVYESVEQLPPFEDYRMANRTYRYFSGTPLYPFGFGLSYTQFSYEKLSLSKAKIKVGEPVEVQVTVRNTGKIAGDEVVQVYVSAQNAPVPVALKALKGFRRISLAAGASQVVRFTLNPADFSHIDAAFQRASTPGEFKIRVGGSSASGISASLRIE